MKKRLAKLKFLQRLSAAKLWLSGSLGILLLAIIIFGIPKWQVPAKVIDPRERAELENANRQTAIQALGGLFFLVTAGLTLKNIQLTEDKNVTDRFAKAVEMLADEKLEVRLGGIYSLERIARDSKKDHPVVMEVLTAFIRQNAVFNEENNVQPSPEIQSALTVIGRRKTTFDSQALDLHDTYLKEANLTGAHLENACLYRADLTRALLGGAYMEGANLISACLEGAKMPEAHLEEAFLKDANLQGSDMAEANLQGANLIKANLERANLNEACLQETILVGAHLQETNLRNANLEGANMLRAYLKGTFLIGASLVGVQNLTEEQLAEALLCRTFLPEWIDSDLRNRDCQEVGLKPD